MSSYTVIYPSNNDLWSTYYVLGTVQVSGVTVMDRIVRILIVREITFWHPLKFFIMKKFRPSWEWAEQDNELHLPITQTQAQERFCYVCFACLPCFLLNYFKANHRHCVPCPLLYDKQPQIQLFEQHTFVISHFPRFRNRNTT